MWKSHIRNFSLHGAYSESKNTLKSFITVVHTRVSVDLRFYEHFFQTVTLKNMLKTKETFRIFSQKFCVLTQKWKNQFLPQNNNLRLYFYSFYQIFYHFLFGFSISFIQLKNFLYSSKTHLTYFGNIYLSRRNMLKQFCFSYLKYFFFF